MIMVTTKIHFNFGFEFSLNFHFVTSWKSLRLALIARCV